MTDKIILMADNLKDFLDERREFLEQAGYTVVTTYNPTDAGRILERGGIDLAIMDIRMVNDDDPEDTSGLELARRYGPKLPVLMLTGYPTWENVKAAIGRDLQGLSPAVDFLSKEEGPGVMVQAVKLTLDQPSLKRNILAEFKAESSQAFHDALEKGNPEETTELFQKSLERTERELLKHRGEVSHQAEQYQKIATWAGLTGMAVIILGALLVFFNGLPVGPLSAAAGVLSEAVSVLFIRRASQASKEVNENYAELQETCRASQLISMCDTIKGKTRREEAKFLILTKLAELWLR